MLCGRCMRWVGLCQTNTGNYTADLDPQISRPQVSSSSDCPDWVMTIQLVDTVHLLEYLDGLL